jgi:hypothetical protein
MQKLNSIALMFAGLVVTAVAFVWFRQTANDTIGKGISDRAKKADVTPVRW